MNEDEIKNLSELDFQEYVDENLSLYHQAFFQGEYDESTARVNMSKR